MYCLSKIRNPPPFNFMKQTHFFATHSHNKKSPQVILTEEWAKLHSSIHFSSMHPGWADTPAVQNSMPDFHRRMEGKLRSSMEGADTIVWLACKEEIECKSGLFFLGLYLVHVFIYYILIVFNSRTLYHQLILNVFFLFFSKKNLVQTNFIYFSILSLLFYHISTVWKSALRWNFIIVFL